MTLRDRTRTISGTKYTIRAPLGRDWLAVAELGEVSRSLELIRLCVSVQDRPAFKTSEEVEAVPMATLLELDRVVGSMLEYEIPDPI